MQGTPRHWYYNYGYYVPHWGYEGWGGKSWFSSASSRSHHGQIQSMSMRELVLLNFLRWDALNSATNVSGRVVSQDLRIGARWTARVSVVPLLALHH